MIRPAPSYPPTPTPTPLPPAVVESPDAMVVNPKNTTTLYAGTPQGLVKRTLIRWLGGQWRGHGLPAAGSRHCPGPGQSQRGVCRHRRRAQPAGGHAVQEPGRGRALDCHFPPGRGRLCPGGGPARRQYHLRRHGQGRLQVHERRSVLAGRQHRPEVVGGAGVGDGSHPAGRGRRPAVPDPVRRYASGRNLQERGRRGHLDGAGVGRRAGDVPWR